MILPNESRNRPLRGTTRSVPLAVAFFLLLGLFSSLLLAHRTARAQDNGGNSTDAIGQQLIDELEDINRLNVLVPLKITADQADKLATLVTEAKAAYDRNVIRLGAPPLIKIASEIHQTRHKALLGEPIPPEFIERIQKLDNTFQAKRDKLNSRNLESVRDGVMKILTPKQVAVAVQMEKNALAKLKALKSGDSDTQFFTLYTMDVFISNPRIVPLLRAMQEAMGGVKEGANDGNGAAGSGQASP